MAIILDGCFDSRYDPRFYVMIRTAVIRRVEFRDADRKPAKRFELEVHYQHRHMSNGEKGAPVSEHTATIELTPEQADMLMAPIYERLNAKIGGETDGQARTPVEVAEPVAVAVVAEEKVDEAQSDEADGLREQLEARERENEALREKLAEKTDEFLFPAPDEKLAEWGKIPVSDEDITGDQLLDAFERDEAEAVDPEKEALREQVADLQRQLAERDAEPLPLSPDPVKHMIPDEIRNLMQEGESLSSAKRRLTELLWVEQAELRNLRATDRENLKREAEIERLLGLFARLGEI